MALFVDASATPYLRGHLSFRDTLNCECFSFNLLKFNNYLLKAYAMQTTDR